jgi:hypothetical protein
MLLSDHSTERKDLAMGNATARPLAFSLSLGTLGAGALIVTVSNTHRGPAVMLPYAALVILAAIYLRAEHVQGFLRRFGMTLTTFMVATVILYVFIGAVQAKTLTVISLWGHAWRLGLMLALGSVIAAAVAQVTSTRPAH